MKVHLLQHVPHEGPGHISSWVVSNGHELATTRLDAGEVLPGWDEFEWLVVLGGPMNIYEDEKYPWLAAERDFVAEAVRRQKVTVGICLGAQLLADALGARVYPGGQREIGWFPVEIMHPDAESSVFEGLPRRLEVFQWHGDTYDLPKGARHLARSEACEQQAFIYKNRALGLQFHLEMTSVIAEEMIRTSSDDLLPGPYIQGAEDIVSDTRRFERLGAVMSRVLTQLEGVAIG